MTPLISLKRRQQPTLLIVEDVPTLRVTLEQAVRALGYNVRSFASAEDLLEFLKTHSIEQYRGLLTDFSLGGMNGVELSQTLRKRAPNFPIILMSGKSGTEFLDGKRPIGVEAARFLEKPFRLADLDETLRSTLLAS